MTWSLVAMLSSTVDTYSVLYWAGSWKNFMIFFVIGYFAFLHVATLRSCWSSCTSAAFPTIACRKWPNVVVFGSGMFRRRLVDFAGDDAFRAVFPGLSAFLGRRGGGCARRLVVSGSDMNGLAGIFAPRAMFPTIAGVPQIQEQIVDVVLHSTGGDQQHRVTDRVQYHRSWRNCGGDSETVQFPDKVIAMSVVLTKVQFPGRVVDTPVVFNDTGHGPEFPDKVQLLGKVVDTPVVYNDRGHGPEFPDQVQLLGKVVDTPVVYIDRGHGPDRAVPGQGCCFAVAFTTGAHGSRRA